jgi:hypothetical protein
MAKIREVAFLMQGHAKIISAKLFPMHGLRTPCRAPSLALLEPVPL